LKREEEMLSLEDQFSCSFPLSGNVGLNLFNEVMGGPRSNQRRSPACMSNIDHREHRDVIIMTVRPDLPYDVKEKENVSRTIWDVERYVRDDAARWLNMTKDEGTQRNSARRGGFFNIIHLDD